MNSLLGAILNKAYNAGLTGFNNYREARQFVAGLSNEELVIIMNHIYSRR